MSRSYRKYPIVRQEKENHHYLNRRIRYDRLATFPNSSFKRRDSHWNNWNYRWTKEEAIQEYYEEERIRDRYPSLEEWLNYWAKCTLRK